jgi:hypothetical protein
MTAKNPQSYVRKMAAEVGISTAKAEQIWEHAKDGAKAYGRPGTDRYWAAVTGIFRNIMMGIKGNPVVSVSELRSIARSINLDDVFFEYVGLRVTAKGYIDYSAKPGDVLLPSHRWDDGDPTEDELGGTSAISVSFLQQTKPHPLDGIGGYHGDRVLLIGGNRHEYGEDRGEIVISNATVIAVFKPELKP